MKNKIIKNKKNKMEKYILFSNLVELQALVQLYNVYSDIEEHESYKNKKKQGYLDKIKNKVVIFDLMKFLEEILDNKIPVIGTLIDYKPYQEFLRTNYLPVKNIIFEIDKKRPYAKAFYNYI
jgi:hypothetical protein